MHEPMSTAEGAALHEEPLLEQPAEETQAWEEIDAGRFMPRRIRGSYRGRHLG